MGLLMGDTRDEGGDHWEEETTVSQSPGIVSLDRGETECWFEQIQGPGAVRKLAIGEGDCVVGRSRSATMVISSELLSREHLVLTWRGEELHCRDLESANGVYLNGVKIHSAVLRNGDSLQLGDVVLVFYEGRT